MKKKKLTHISGASNLCFKLICLGQILYPTDVPAFTLSDGILEFVEGLTLWPERELVTVQCIKLHVEQK